MSAVLTRFIAPQDELELRVGARSLAGWQRINVERGLEAVPANFDIQLTEAYPGQATTVSVAAGDPCEVLIGGDLVITGYVDSYTATLTAGEHAVRIQGRSKSADLVDCSAEIPGMQIKGGNALTIAQQIAATYGIIIASQAGPGAQIQQFNVNVGETCWEIIDRVMRYSKLAGYDMPDGSINFAQAGTETMASGFIQGQNIEQATITYSMAERFSEYEGLPLSALIFTVEGGGTLTGGKIVRDNGVTRFRKRFIVSEQASPLMMLVEARAQWECNRRIGQGQRMQLVADSWRDAAGALWAPNHRAPFDIPALKATKRDWLIASVAYLRDESGTHAGITLMPVEAFSPEPILIQPTVITTEDVDKMLNRNPAAKP